MKKPVFDTELHTALSEQRREILKKAGAFDYDYGPYAHLPKDKGLAPGGELHDKLLLYGLDIATRGYAPMIPCHENMRQADWAATAFVTPEDANRRNTPKDRKRAIVHPLSFRMEEMYCTAAHSVFDQDPVFKWKPFPGFESVVNAATAEYLIQRHCLWFNFGLHRDSVTRDAFRYGFGVAGLKWTTERARKPVDHDITEEVLSMLQKDTGISLPKNLIGRVLRDMEEQIIAEGSELQPWDPYTTFWDPSVTPNNFEKAAFIGTLYTCDSSHILLYEHQYPGQWFNGWHFKTLAEKGYAQSQFNRKNESGRDDRTGARGVQSMGGTNSGGAPFSAPGDVLYQELMLIPSDWGIGDETYPIKHYLAIGSDEIVLGFGQLDRAHGGYDAAIMAPNADGHTFVPVSHILTTMGLQEHVDDFLRCTTASMKKNVNGGWTIVNENMLNMDDVFNNDEPGKLVRTAMPMASREMMEATILNIPHQHNGANALNYINELVYAASDGNGTLDIGGPGQLAQADRPTKFGMQAMVNTTSSRFRRLAFKMGQQFMSPIGWKMAYNLTEFAKQKQQVDLAGRFADRIRREMGGRPTNMSMLVDPRDINLHFEMEPYTGAMPQQDDLAAMSEVLKVLMAIPEVAMQGVEGLPIASLFRTFARRSGFETLDDYPIEEAGGGGQPTVMPDEMVRQMEQAGNLVRMNQMQGAA